MKNKPSPKSDTAWKPLASEMRTGYIRRRSALLNQTYRLPTRNDALEHWEAPARLCAESSMQPGPFLDLLFKMWPDKMGPLPNHMAGHTAHVILKRACNRGHEESALTSTMAATHIVQTSLLDAVKAQWRTLKERSGTAYPEDPRALKCLRDYTEALEPWFRIAVAGQDPEVWQLFSYPGLEHLRINPPLATLLKSACAPIDQIMERPPAPPPEWMKDILKERARVYHD